MKKKKEKSLVKAKAKKELLWGGAADLMAHSQSDQHKGQVKDSIVVVAKALDISPFGVNILGGLPYINNLGLKQKSQHYHRQSNFEYQWINRALNDTDRAICEARLVQGKKILTPWIVGEAAPSNIKMGTVKTYQNHIAQTRAENRCIRYIDGVKMHEELLENINKMLHKGEIIDEQLALNASQATLVSADEMGDDKPALVTVAKPASNSKDTVMKAIQKITTVEQGKKWLDRLEETNLLSKEEKIVYRSMINARMNLAKGKK